MWKWGLWKDRRKRIANNVKKAFEIGAMAIRWIILAKIIKGGIGVILGGPVGVDIAFAT